MSGGEHWEQYRWVVPLEQCSALPISVAISTGFMLPNPRKWMSGEDNVYTKLELRNILSETQRLERMFRHWARQSIGVTVHKADPDLIPDTQEALGPGIRLVFLSIAGMSQLPDTKE